MGDEIDEIDPNFARHDGFRLPQPERQRPYGRFELDLEPPPRPRRMNSPDNPTTT